MVAIVVALHPAAAGADAPSDLWVDVGNDACSDAFGREQASDPSTPWCSIVRAGSSPLPGTPFT
jgi:hypothetical protein